MMGGPTVTGTSKIVPGCGWLSGFGETVRAENDVPSILTTRHSSLSPAFWVEKGRPPWSFQELGLSSGTFSKYLQVMIAVAEEVVLRARREMTDSFASLI